MTLICVDVTQATHVSDELHLLHRAFLGFYARKNQYGLHMSLRVVAPKRISI